MSIRPGMPSNSVPQTAAPLPVTPANHAKPAQLASRKAGAPSSGKPATKRTSKLIKASTKNHSDAAPAESAAAEKPAKATKPAAPAAPKTATPNSVAAPAAPPVAPPE